MLPFKIILRNKPDRDGFYPIILRINKNRKSKIVTLGICCKKEHWDQENNLIKRGDKRHLQKNEVLINLQKKAQRIIDDYQSEGLDFTLAEFEQKLRGKEREKITVNDLFQEKIKFLMSAGKIEAAQPLITSQKSLLKFAKRNLKFRELTPEFLRKYEIFLRSQGSSEGGVAFKMREIRSIFNDAIDDGHVPYDIYPFRKYKLSKLKGESRKIALSLEDWELFRKADLSENPHLINSHKYFLFSYYTRGMNFKDMMYLKWDNIKAGKIYYTRSKTKKRFVIRITAPVQEVLDFFTSGDNESSFIFPILLRERMTPQQIFNRKHKVLRRYNKDLREIAEIVVIPDRITSYVARHSYATHMKQKGRSIEVISESMGHSSVEVTMSYLKDFEDDYLDDENEKLLEESAQLYTTLKAC